MVIQIADSKDAEFIALLGRITFTETFGHVFSDSNDLLNYLDQTFGVQKIRSSLQKENNVFWIAFERELPVGYAKLKMNSTTPFLSGEKICQLQKIYVLKDLLSKKIGRALQNKLWEYASEKGFEKIWLSVLKNNKRAIQFYEKNDFSFIGNHTFQIGKEIFDFQAMSKNL